MTTTNNQFQNENKLLQAIEHLTKDMYNTNDQILQVKSRFEDFESDLNEIKKLLKTLIEIYKDIQVLEHKLFKTKYLDRE